MNYFIITNDVQQGPFTVEELRQRGITTDTLVWCEGMTDWQPAWKVEELRPLFYGQTTPPPPPTSASQTQTGGSQPQQGVTPPPYTTAQVGGTGTATPPPGAMNNNLVDPTAGEPRRRSRTPLIIAIVLVGLLIIAAISNPGVDEHRRVIKEHLVSAVEKTFDAKGGGLVAQGMSMLSQAIFMPVVNEAVDDLTVYHNYVFWSTTSVTYNDKDRTTSFGFFGHVFTMDEEQLADSISHSITGQVQSSSSFFGSPQSSTDSVDEEQGDASTDQDDASADESQDATDEQLNQAARNMGNAIVDKVGKDVKDRIAQETDSATSSGLSAIIDDIVSFFKGK